MRRMLELRFESDNEAKENQQAGWQKWHSLFDYQ